MNSIGGLSNKEISEMVQWFDSRRWSSGSIFGGLSSNNDSEVCQMNSIEGLSNKGFSEMVQWFDIRRVVQ